MDCEIIDIIETILSFKGVIFKKHTCCLLNKGQTWLLLSWSEFSLPHLSLMAQEQIHILVNNTYAAANHQGSEPSDYKAPSLR